MAEGIPLPNGFFVSKTDEDEVMQAIRQRQSDEERRKIRESYRFIQCELTERKQELINPADEKDLLSENVLKVDKLFGPVRNPREGAVDSACLVTISERGKEKAQALKTDFITFIPADFCDKVRTTITGDYVNQHGLSSQNWAQLGNAVQPFFRKVPVLRFMCGSFEKGEVLLKKSRQPRERDKDDANIRSTKPTQLSSFEETDRGELTTAQVEHLLDTLWKIKEEVDGPICFFEFVTNPFSFGETVENIFYASFLVRDGHARVYLDSDELPVIEPISREEKGDTGQTVPNRQVVLTITPEEWEEIVETFKIEEPVIKTSRKIEVLKEINRPPSPPNKTDTSDFQGKGKGKGKKSKS